MLFISAPLAGWISNRTDSRYLIYSLLFLFQVIVCQIIGFVVVQGLVGGVIPTAT
jgi:hypothetical protein